MARLKRLKLTAAALVSLGLVAPPEARALATAGLTSPVDQWSQFINEASARFGIPVEWIRRVMKAESGGRTHQGGRPITSHAGAMGLMQLMPGTWREMRAAYGLGPDPHAPRDNILGGTAYLRLMYDRFGYPGLFGAYNAGPARYAAYLRGRRLPGETVAYMAKVSGAATARPVGQHVARPIAPTSLFAALSKPERPLVPPETLTPPPPAESIFVPLRGAPRHDGEDPEP